MEYRHIDCNSKSPLFDTTNMQYREFPSDYRQIRYYTLLIVQAAPQHIKEDNVLEQQISELIHNAIQHGNAGDLAKNICVWYDFTAAHAHIIVQDSGSGFQEIEKWNEINRKRQICLQNNQFDELPSLFFKGAQSSENDSGTSLFIAVEYWDGGLVFNDTKNAVAALKNFSNTEITEISEL